METTPVNDLERFKAVVHFERPDYVPIFAFPGAPGMSGGCMEKTHRRLVETGMPAEVGGLWNLSLGITDVESWYRYWGTTGPISGPSFLGRGVEGFAQKRRIEGGFEIIESESGAVTRQVIDNDVTYSMPAFLVYPVRDRPSWEFYRKRMTPAETMSPQEVQDLCRRYERRDRPLSCAIPGAYGMLRDMMGPEALSLAFHDDPQLVADMAQWNLEMVREYYLPLLERLGPEVILMGEDLCYNHGMLLSPDHFGRFFGAHYRQVCQCARAIGTDLVAVDTDGNCMEFVDVAAGYGVNAFFPNEVKAGNDLFAMRDRHPQVVFFGWLEKETVNEHNEHLIRPEIMSKVPPLLARGGYFPNGDHGIQPLVTFENMCRFMTLLHEVTGNPTGEFPRMDA